MDWPTTQKRLADDADNWGVIAKAVGLPRMTIARIGTGKTPAPRIDTAQKIADYYAEHDAVTARGKRRTRRDNGNGATAPTKVNGKAKKLPGNGHG